MFRAYEHWPGRSEAPRYLAELFTAKLKAAEANPVGSLFIELPAKTTTAPAFTAPAPEPRFTPIGRRPTIPDDGTLTLAILVKDKAHLLAEYLQCIEKQTWPKFATCLYVRTNNNNDNTKEILRAWVDRVGTQYLEIHFDDSDVEQKVERFGQHEWNGERFAVLGAIRQASLDWARKRGDHYAVVDCDNMIGPDTLASMMAVLTPATPIVAPLLRSAQNGGWYSNYHADIDANGYYQDTPLYATLLERRAVGLVEVPVVHCTYAIHASTLSQLSYNDGSGRYEYVIFSDSARKALLPQYLDTRKVYGHISFAETREQFLKEPWLADYAVVMVPEIEPSQREWGEGLSNKFED